MKARTTLAAVLGTALLVGCTDADRGSTPLASDALRSGAVAAAYSTEKAALTELTRAVALALQDQGLRQRIRNDLRESRHTVEHKLHFRDYLQGRSGGILLAKMAAVSGRSRQEVLSLLAQVRPLEFYMPVGAHRASWRGGAELRVGSYLEDDGSELPAVYDVNGSAVPLWNPAENPPVPTLVLVPVETDFTRPLPSRVPNRDDNGGESIGTLAIEPDNNLESGGGGSTKPAGLYMTYAYGEKGVPDGLYGLMGEPEIEAHIFGQSSTDATQATSLACSWAGHADAYRRFDMNDHSWSGDVLLFSQTEIDNYRARTTEDFAVQVWEDDDTSCQVKTDKDLAGFMKWVYDTWNNNAIKTDDGKIDWGKLLKTAYALASWLKTNDDFVGTGHGNGILLSGGTLTLQHPDDTDGYNGEVTLVQR